MSNNKKKHKDPREKLSPLPWLTGIAAVAAICIVFYVIYLLTDAPNYEKFTEKSDGVIVSEKTGFVYMELSKSYEECLRVSSEAYGKLGDKLLYCLAYEKDGKTTVVSGERYLVEKLEDGGRVYARNDEVIPTLDAFDPSIAYICHENDGDNGIVYDTMTSLSEDGLKAFVNGYLKKELYEGKGVPYQTFEVKIESNTYPFLRYILYLVRCDNGDYYAYGAIDRKGYTVDSSLFTNALGGSID